MGRTRSLSRIVNGSVASLFSRCSCGAARFLHRVACDVFDFFDRTAEMFKCQCHALERWVIGRTEDCRHFALNGCKAFHRCPLCGHCRVTSCVGIASRRNRQAPASEWLTTITQASVSPNCQAVATTPGITPMVQQTGGRAPFL